MIEPIVVGQSPLTLEDVGRIADGAPVALAAEARRRVAEARAVVERKAHHEANGLLHAGSRRARRARSGHGEWACGSHIARAL